MQNLGARKLRALLTMLGIIFGVAAVVSMLSIGAGAQQQVLAFIEQLGVRNLIVEAKDVTDTQELLKIRKTSPGLSFKDLRVIRANVSNLTSVHAAEMFYAERHTSQAPAGHSRRLWCRTGISEHCRAETHRRALL